MRIYLPILNEWLMIWWYLDWHGAAQTQNKTGNNNYLPPLVFNHFSMKHNSSLLPVCRSLNLSLSPSLPLIYCIHTCTTPSVFQSLYRSNPHSPQLLFQVCNESLLLYFFILFFSAMPFYLSLFFIKSFPLYCWSSEFLFSSFAGAVLGLKMLATLSFYFRVLVRFYVWFLFGSWD